MKSKHRNFRTALCVAVALTTGTALSSTPAAEIKFSSNRAFPESLTSLSDGTLIVGGVGAKTIFRVKPGSDIAEPWIQPGTDGMQGIYGVFAHERSNTLYACSGSSGPRQKGQPPTEVALYAFDLTTGAPRGHYPLPMAGAICNDIAVGNDGTVYATDFMNSHIVSLKPGSKQLDTWAADVGVNPESEIPKYGLDGIAVLGDRVIVNNFHKCKLFSIPIGQDGKAGLIAEIQLDGMLLNPDGMRAFGTDSLLVAEAGTMKDCKGEEAVVDLNGRLSRVVLTGNTGKVTPIRTGFSLGAVAVAAVGQRIYVLEGGIGPLFWPDRYQGAKEPLYRVIAISTAER